MRKTHTRTGLTTTVHVIRKAYELGRQVTEQALQSLNITYAVLPPRWNYIISPQ